MTPVMSLASGRTSPRPQAASESVIINRRTAEALMRPSLIRCALQAWLRPIASQMDSRLPYKAAMAVAAVNSRLENGGREWLGFGGLLLLGAVLWLVCRYFPAELPFWL